MGTDFSLRQSSPDQTWFTSGSPSKSQAARGVVRKTARWNHTEHKVFIDTCELVIAKGHQRGKSLSSKGWHHIAEMFNTSTGKDWTTSQMKNYWNKLRADHKLMFELLRCTGIEYRSGTGKIHAPDRWWESKIKSHAPPPGYFVPMEKPSSKDDLHLRKRTRMRRELCSTYQVEESYPSNDNEVLQSPRNHGDGKYALKFSTN